MSTLYLTVEEVLHLHRRLLERFGGTGGVRDLGLLESALHRPRSGYYETLSQQAAALLQSLVMNHAFVDGNKRVAFAATMVFLRINGYVLQTTADAGETFLIERVIQKRIELNEITAWVEQHIKPGNA